ncbi:MAG: hypothetical protein IPN83_25355 [Holophagales bacterium]|nr:hypothetical protein [Holophagales bacterium]
MKKQRLSVLMACCALVAFGVPRPGGRDGVEHERAARDPRQRNVDSMLTFSVNGTISDANLTVDIAHVERRHRAEASEPERRRSSCGRTAAGAGDNLSATIDQDAAESSLCPTARPITGSFQPTDGTAFPSPPSGP